MRVLVAVLLVAAFVAGCTSAPEPTVQPPIVAPPAPFAVLNRVIDPAGGMGEPSLAVLADGTLFTNGEGAAVAQGAADRIVGGIGTGAVYRSTDNGTTWKPLDTGLQTPDLDADLVADADGNLWYDTLWVGCTSVAVSRNHGDSWSSTPVACNAPGDDRQYVVATSGGTAYLFSHQLPSYYHTASKTTDYGTSWVPTGPMEGPDHQLFVNGGSSWSGGGFWNPKTGSVFATWSRFLTGVANPSATDPNGFVPAFSVTRDGLTWTESTAAKNSTGDPLGLSLVVGSADDAGNIYIAWGSIDRDDVVGMFVAGSKDDGRTWTPAVRVDQGGNSKVFPAITAGQDGHVAIGYYQADKPGYPSKVDGKTTWNVTLAWTDGFWGNATWSHAAFSNGTVRKGPICPDGSGCNSDREFLDYFALKRLPDGRVGSVWNSSEAVKGKTVNVFGRSTDPILGAKHPTA